MIKLIPNTTQVKAIDSKLDATGSFKICNIQKPKDDYGLPNEIELGQGAKVMVTKNINVEDKIVNGTLGTVAGFSLNEDNTLRTVWVTPDDKTAGKLKRKEVSREMREAYPGAIPIRREQTNIEVANNNSSFKRSQFPLKLSWAATIHKYQGRSLPQVVVGGFTGGYWRPGMLYTAATRATTAEGFFVQEEFDPTAFKANAEGQREIERIHRESMVTFQHDRLDFFQQFAPTEWNYVTLQNVRSVPAHKDDIFCDQIMMASSIMCLTETSLDNNEWPNWKEFKSFNIFHKSRQESFDTSAMASRKSGGVAILVKKEYSASRDVSCEIDNLEMLSCNTNFSLGSSRNTSFSLIYKDHKIPKREFHDKIISVFRSSKETKLVLGDFNYNMVEDTSIQDIAENEGFQPTVSRGTTIHDHLLDQIFISPDVNNNNLAVCVLPSYFSDHHLVVLCVPRGSQG